MPRKPKGERAGNTARHRGTCLVSLRTLHVSLDWKLLLYWHFLWDLFFCISTVDVAMPHFSRVVDPSHRAKDCFLETQAKPMVGDEETKTKARDSHRQQEIVFKRFFSLISSSRLNINYALVGIAMKVDCEIDFWTSRGFCNTLRWTWVGWCRHWDWLVASLGWLVKVMGGGEGVVGL